MATIEDSIGNDTNNGEQPAQKERVIIPPPEIKAMVEKAASYVAKHGQNFEQMILKVENNNPKFNFLKYGDDPYRPYYLQKLKEYLGEADEAKQAANNGEGTEQAGENGDQQIQDQEMVQQEDGNQPTGNGTQKPARKENEHQASIRKAIFGDLEEGKQNLNPPPGDQFNISHPVLANIDMDIIKLTAQFVAHNGQKFLQGLTERERQNPQFDFLKPTHGLFHYFTQLVECYSKVLVPRNEWLQKCQKHANDKISVMKTAGERYLWEKMKNEERRAKGEAEEQEGKQEVGMEVDAIDWHDFVVVEQIDLYDEEMKDEENEEDEALRLEHERKQTFIRKQIEENQQILTMPMPGMEPPKPKEKEKTINSALDPNMKVVTDYKRPKQEEKKKTGTQKCPNCQQDIPISEWAQHLKLELMDPKWRENKQKIQERQNLNTLASGDEIAQNLRRFASQRQDIFKQGEEGQSQESRVIWDGQASSITRTTANVAMMAHQQQKNLQEALHKRGELDQRSMEKLQGLQLPQNVVAVQNQILQHKKAQGQKNAVRIEDDEEESLKILEPNLRPESEWLRLYPGKLNVTIRIQEDQQEIGCRSSQIPLSVESKMTIQQVKDRIALLLKTVQSANIRLRGSQNLPLKDQLTLAFFNVPDGAMLDLVLKDKKKK